ncbi:MAG: YceD family protein [Stenotrophobium sp.]
MSIPQKVRASTAVKHQQHYAGAVAVNTLPRLVEALAGGDGELQVDLLARKSAGYPALTGTVGGTVMLNCRRCGQAYASPLDLKVDLRLVQSEEEEARLWKDCEPYWVQDDTLLLREVVEDEVLLALPMLPRCDSCENIASAAPDTGRAEQARREKQNPFADLKKLM